VSKKKIIRAEDITEKDILSLYEAVLPLLIYNPKKIPPANRLKDCLQKYIQYDFGYYAMENPTLETKEDKQFLIFREDLVNKEKKFSSLLTDPLIQKEQQTIDEMAKHCYNNTIRDQEKLFKGNIPPFDNYSMKSDAYPKLVIGLFRYKKDGNAFTESDIAVLKLLERHIFLLFRSIINHLTYTPTASYFTIINNVSEALANKYALTDNEYKLIPEILAGLTNEEIAEKHFMSLPTVKKHFTNLFKKTHSKNRGDLISKFFILPE
jgi:DNA-binding CsgD family transcriptional regulator